MLGYGKLSRWLPIGLCAWPLSGCIQEQDGKKKTENEIERRVNAMSFEEKIGQKLMLDFCYWDPNGRLEQDMIASAAMVSLIIRNNFISVVILFTNGFKNPSQIEALTSWYTVIKPHSGLRLFIATDNEYGIKFRFPRVDRLRKDAFAIDSVSYEHAIDNHIAHDMLMTAHIQ